MRKLLRCIGTILALIIFSLVGMMAYLALAGRHVEKVAAKFAPGMSAKDVVAGLSSDGSYFVNVSARGLTVPCKDEVENIHSPSEFSATFPDMDGNDGEGAKLARAAQILPFQLERYEALDKHLRERKDWARLVRAWTVFIEDDDTPKEVAYVRRGSAYLAVNDVQHGYKDARAACKLGNKEGCALARKASKDKVAAIEADAARFAVNAPACEKRARVFMVSAPSTPEFMVNIYSPKGSGSSESKRFSRAEFAEMIDKEYQGREWRFGFTFLTMTPQHISFAIDMGRDGKVQRVLGPQAWD